jgi:hypothetical protein
MFTFKGDRLVDDDSKTSGSDMLPHEKFSLLLTSFLPIVWSGVGETAAVTRTGGPIATRSHLRSRIMKICRERTS